MVVIEKNPLKRFGFVENFKTLAEDLQRVCDSKEISISSIIKNFEEKESNNEIIYYKSNISSSGEKDSAVFACFDTGCKNNEGVAIIGYFERQSPSAGWKGVRFCTHKALADKYSDIFNCGSIKFKPFTAARKFFKELSDMAIPETWDYKKIKSQIPHPILKAYIENTYYKLVHEQEEKSIPKIIINDAQTHLLFNTGLLDIYFHEIYLLAELPSERDGYVCYNPILTTSLMKVKEVGGFRCDGKPINSLQMMPKKAEFFKEIKEVIYDIQFPIDKDFTKFTHIIMDNRSRFPKKYVNSTSAELARKVDDAINFALLMAERNYKFIVPQYRPKQNKIQFLMPLYLDGNFVKAPDLALVLDLKENMEIYVPETVLELDSAYQNARLIAKPDNQWLDPNNVEFLES